MNVHSWKQWLLTLKLHAMETLFGLIFLSSFLVFKNHFWFACVGVLISGLGFFCARKLRKCSCQVINLESLALSKNKKQGVSAKETSQPTYETSLEQALPYPLLILDKNKIVGAYGFLKNKWQKGEITRIPDVAPCYDNELSKQTATFEDKTYILYTNSFQTEQNDVKKELKSVMFMQDMQSKASKDTSLEHMVVALVFIDNYDEVLDTMEDVRRPLLAALIDRKLNSLAQQTGGIITKFEKDKFLLVFSHEKLGYLKEKRFDILGQIREIDMGNKIPVTLSIGIGVNGISLAKNMEFARTAIDLALGRGGDQALVKDADQYYFFGGVSKEVAVNARVRARVKSYAFAELIRESENVLVLGHKNIDLDCLGASIGVYKIVTSLGRECNIVLGPVTTNTKYLHERLVADTEYKNRVFLNVEQAIQKTKQKTLVVVVDTHRPSMVEGNEILQLPQTKRVVVFDHHRMATELIDNPVLSYHEPYASSTCELITEMLQYTKAEIKLRAVEADALLAGITVDTKNFAIKTGAKTFEAAAYLRRNGADSVRVKMLFQNDLASFRAKAAAVNSAEIWNDCMAVSVSPSNIENPALTAAQAADELLNIYGVSASFVLCQSDGTVFISARSLCNINVQVIMEKMGGGGHQTVAGVQLPNESLQNAEDRLRQAIDSYLKETKDN